MKIRNRSALFAVLAMAGLCFQTSLVQAQQKLPNPGLNPTFGSVNLRGGFPNDPFSKNLTAGGSINFPFAKYVAEAPDFQLNWTANGDLPLTIYVESQKDTTLLIYLPDGSWIMNDDGGPGLNPMIKIHRPLSGRYTIWVGTFNSQLTQATLKISELK